ncbi:MAG: hypothetical protein MZW92_25780 [Comamonadaceae bacterium]|nr:hypothetical protein [Comamonadaceae bacterium]
MAILKQLLARAQKGNCYGRPDRCLHGATNNNIEEGDGTVVLTGKDNIVLVSTWDKNSAVDVLPGRDQQERSGMRGYTTPARGFREWGHCLFYSEG